MGLWRNWHGWTHVEEGQVIEHKVALHRLTLLSFPDLLDLFPRPWRAGALFVMVIRTFFRNPKVVFARRFFPKEALLVLVINPRGVSAKHTVTSLSCYMKK